MAACNDCTSYYSETYFQNDPTICTFDQCPGPLCGAIAYDLEGVGPATGGGYLFAYCGGSQLDLADATPQVSQAGASVNPNNGLLQVAPGVPVQVIVPISGSGFNSPETRTTSVTLQAGSQNPSQTISLADIQSGAVTSVTFNVTFDPSLAGTTQTITATIDPGNALGESNFSNNTASVQVDVGPQLAVSQVHFAQSVQDFQLSPPVWDFIRGKEAVLRVYVYGVGIDPNDARPLTVQAQIGQAASPITQQVPLNSILPGPIGTEVDFFFTPSSVTVPGSPDQITITLDPNSSILGSPVTYPGTNAPPVSFNVDYTRPLNIGFVPINGCGSDSNCYFGGKITEYGADVQNSSTFIQATYPIADTGSFLGDLGITNFSGATNSSPESSQDFYGIAQDLLGLSRLAKLNGMDAVGAIVPATYFAYHNLPEDAGITLPTSPALTNHSFIVTDTFWEASGHELGHLFSMGEGYNADGSCSASGSAQASYWPSEQLPIPALPGIMCNSYPNTLVPPSNWMDLQTYTTAFFTLENPATDPEVLLISGILTSNGQFQSAAFDDIKSRTLSAQSSSGAFSVKALDPSGNLLYQVSQQPQFSLFIDPASTVPIDNVTVGQVPVTSVPVIVSIPYSSNIGQVQIGFQGKVISSVSPGPQLLITAIKAIPTTSFKHNPIEGERDLLARADVVERDLDACQKSVRGKNSDGGLTCANWAIRSVMEFREQINRSLNDSSTTANPLQMTKPQVLATVDSVVLRLLPTMTVPGHDHPFRIWVLPPDQDDARGVFSVVAVTQGSNGAVYINKDGSVTYKPTGTPTTDSFTVTLKDEEGSTVQRVVNITAPPPHCDEHGRDFDYFGRSWQ